MKCVSRGHIFAGFTIVETLVVISIITLLLSISMPSFSKARRLARASICLSNLDQLQSAQLMYSDENKGLTKNLSHASGEYWHHSLAQYLGDATYRANANLQQWKRAPMNVLTCPEAVRDPVAGAGSADIVWNWGGGGGQGSYGANLWMFPQYQEYNHDFRFPRQGFYPRLADGGSDAPLFADSNWVGGWPLDVDTVPPNLYWGYFIHEIGYFMGRFSLDRHDRSIQLAFADGSSRRTPLAQLWELSWHRGFKFSKVTIP